MEISIKLSQDDIHILLSEQFMSQLPKNWNEIAIRQPDRSSDYKYCFKINYPCYHPAINILGHIVGKTIDECIKQFYDLNYACDDPYNIDAAINCKRNITKFIEINDALMNSIDTNCNYCHKIITQDNVMYYHCCIFHIDCIMGSKLYNCPTCERKWNF